VEQIELIQTLLSAWGTQDVDRMGNIIADDVVYELYGSRHGVLASQIIEGKVSFRTNALQTLAQFDYLQFNPTVLGINNDVARIQVEYVLHHWASGHELAATKRLVIKLSRRRISRIEAYYDRALVQAFVNLIEFDTAKNSQQTSDFASPHELDTDSCKTAELNRSGIINATRGVSRGAYLHLPF
jgi:ketosteroid isomerase-like protein